MKVLRALCIAFSLYSKIPVPQFQWRDEDMRYAMCFFPWVGAVIGAVFYGWWRLCDVFAVGILARTAIAMAIPIFVTGGFHIDGFLDTMDAFHSYQSRERKLEILKDSHIGAFAVIMGFLCALIDAAALSEITMMPAVYAISGGFFLSRCLSGLAVVSFPSAKNDGILFTFASTAHEWIVKLVLGVQTLLAAVWMIFAAGRYGVIALGMALLVFVYYYIRSKKEFGGITGDVAGYFLTLCEVMIAVAMAVAGRF